jgi:hypothetical protein
MDGDAVGTLTVAFPFAFAGADADASEMPGGGLVVDDEQLVSAIGRAASTATSPRRAIG